MDVRASSTTLDTVVFVLLVGVAVSVLTGANAQAPGGPQRVTDETADVLATSTDTITFERSGRVVDSRLLRTLGGGPSERTVSVERRAHGTYAELLAAATVANPEIGDRALTGTGADMERAAANATRRALPTDDENVEVRALWRPYEDARLASTVAVGERPPADADVSVGSVTVASGFPNASRELPPDPGYGVVAEVVATTVVDGLFPMNETRNALASEGPDRAIVAHRYRTASNVLTVDTSEPLADGDVASANGRLAGALVSRIELDLRRTFDSPGAAARSLSVDEVRIVVRTWSA